MRKRLNFLITLMAEGKKYLHCFYYSVSRFVYDFSVQLC